MIVHVAQAEARASETGTSGTKAFPVSAALLSSRAGSSGELEPRRDARLQDEVLKQSWAAALF